MIASLEGTGLVSAPYEPTPEQQASFNPLGLQKPMRLARMIKLYIAATDGLNQKTVAQQSGISESTLSRFLGGDQMPDGRAFAALLAWSLRDQEA